MHQFEAAQQLKHMPKNWPTGTKAMRGLVDTFQQHWENSHCCDIKNFRSDNGLEFVNDNMKQFMESRGIRHQRTVSYSPEQNVCAERDNRTLVEAVRTMLLSRDMDKRFWAEALNTFVYVLNRTGKRTVDNKAPYELWFDKKVIIDNLHAFGCDVFVHIPKEKKK